MIGKDTRVSGYMFESAIEAGLAAAGVDVLLLGPMPTPAIAYLTRTFKAKAGIVISASHNSYNDNGVKFFSNKGEKLDIDIKKFGENKFFYDVIYNPKETEFLKDAKSFGNIVENGKMMFIYQAHQAFSVWHKILPEIDNEVIKIVEK